MAYTVGELVELKKKFRNYSEILALHAPNPYTEDSSDNLPNTKKTKFYIVLAVEPDYIYCAPCTYPLQQSSQIQVKQQIPIPPECLKPLFHDAKENLSNDSSTFDTVTHLAETVSNARRLRSRVSSNTEWAVAECPNYPACERFCRLLKKHPDYFSDPITKRFVEAYRAVSKNNKTRKEVPYDQ